MKKVIGGFLALFCISACGFEPLYAQREDTSGWYFSGNFDTSVTSEMAKVKVEPIAERFGQEIRNELLDLITPRGMPDKPQYRLYVTLRDKEFVQQALRRDITATRERVRYSVVYELVSSQNNETLVHGDSVSFVSYDILANPYSTTMAQKKTQSDAAKIIANDIALRLGAYFHRELGMRGNY